MQISSHSGGMPSAAMLQQMQQKMFKDADTNGDNALTLDEFSNAKGPDGAAASQGPSAADKAKMFKQLDKDGDGKLTASEMQPPPPPSGTSRGAQLDSKTMSALLSLQSDSADTTGKPSDKSSAASDATSRSSGSDTVAQLLAALLKSLDSSQTQSSSSVSLAA